MRSLINAKISGFRLWIIPEPLVPRQEDRRLGERDCIPGSNVVDLVNDALRHRKNFNPHGWRLFAKALSDVNIPEGIVRNENRLKTIQDYKIGALHQPELEEASSVATPPLPGIRPKARKRRAQLARRPYKWFK